MRLVGLLMVPVVSSVLTAVGVYIAAPASADCEVHNGSMQCADGPISNAPVGTYPCVDPFDTECTDDFGYGLNKNPALNN